MGRVVPADGDAWRGDSGKRIQQRRDDGGVTSRVNCYSLGLHRTSPRRGSGARGSLAGVASGTGSEDRGLAGWEHLFRVGTNRFTSQKKKSWRGGNSQLPSKLPCATGRIPGVMEETTVVPPRLGSSGGVCCFRSRLSRSGARTAVCSVPLGHARWVFFFFFFLGFPLPGYRNPRASAIASAS